MGELYAAIDCGTNSVRLLVAGVEAGRLVEVDRRLHITRLGQGVDATGRFHPEALRRTLVAMRDFATQLDALGVRQRRVVATSAARDAANSAEFFAGVLAALGTPAEIISGEEEARLSCLGALRGLSGLDRPELDHPVLDDPVLVMDIGGGSTELVLDRAVSLDVGSVRLRERFLASDPPTPAQVAAATAYVDGLLDASGIDLAAVATWIGVGGTATSLSALAHGLPVYDRDVVHGSVVSTAALEALAESLISMPIAQVSALPTMVPGRADVICGGALICQRVGRRVGVPLLVSEADILDGIIWGLAAGM